MNVELITQTITGEKGIVKPQTPHVSQTSTNAQVSPHIAAKNQQHIDEKTALVVGGVSVGLLMIWLNSS